MTDLDDLRDEELEEEAMDDVADDLEHDLDDLRTLISRLSDELGQAKERELRVLAEFQNYRKRNQSEVALLRALANEAFVTELLPVLDNFERTVAHLDAGATIEAVLTGVSAVEKQLRSVLEGQKVQRIPTVGQPFDPNHHEAVVTEVSDQPEDTVLQELQAGYKMGEKVIRPALVKVAKAG